LGEPSDLRFTRALICPARPMAGNRQLPAAFRNLAGAFAHERGIIDGTFAGDHQIAARRPPVQGRMAGEQFKAWRTTAPRNVRRPTQAARGAGTGIRRAVMLKSAGGPAPVVSGRPRPF